MTLLVSLALSGLEVLGHLRPQGRRQHPAGPLPGDRVKLHANLRLHGPCGTMLSTTTASPFPPAFARRHLVWLLGRYAAPSLKPGMRSTTLGYSSRLVTRTLRCPYSPLP